MMKLGPVEGSPKLPRNAALRVIAVVAQIPEVDSSSQGEDRGEESFEKLPLRLLYRRRVLQLSLTIVIGH